MIKRGYLYLIVSLTIFVSLSSFTLSYGNGIGPCYQSPTLKHDMFNLFDGDPYYDAVEICGLCYACDGAVSDGICPEDFGDENRRASCTNQPDIDCVSRVTGTVYDEEGNFVSGVKITALPPPASPMLQRSEVSDSSGNYFMEEISPARWVFRAEKQGYDTVVEERLVEYGKTNIIDFVMPQGTCNSDCTNSFGRCSAECDGINGCTYPSTLMRELCDDQEPGTQVILNETGEYVEKYACCNSVVKIQEFRPKASVHGDMEQLVLRETVVRMNNDIVKVKIAIWQ